MLGIMSVVGVHHHNEVLLSTFLCSFEQTRFQSRTQTEVRGMFEDFDGIVNGQVFQNLSRSVMTSVIDRNNPVRNLRRQSLVDQMNEGLDVSLFVETR
jgi:hypothetical protein